MVDVSALLSLKPAGAVLDMGLSAGAEAAETNPFSQFLSTQLETQAAAPDDAGLADIAMGEAGKALPGGKILPDDLPAAVALPGEAVDTAEPLPIEPLDRLLAGRLQFVPAKAEARTGKRSSETTAADSEPVKAEDPAAPASPADIPTPLTTEPTILIPSALLARPVTSEAQSDAPSRPTLLPKGVVAPRVEIAPPAIQAVVQAATAVPAAPPPKGAVVASAASLAALAPQPVAPPEDQQAPVKIDTGASVTAIAAATAAPETLRSASKPRAATPRRAEESVAPAAVDAPAATSAERPIVSAAPTPPLTLLAEARQPVVGPATVAVTAPAETTQDFAALVDRLIAARNSAAPLTVQASVAHADFGRVSLDFRHDAGALTVAMTSADPNFAPAVLAALASDKAAPAGDNGRPGQVDAAQAQAAVAVQPGAQAQSQQMPSQNQGQQQSQTFSSGGASPGFQQQGTASHSDGSGRQNGQERSFRNPADPSSPARNDDRPQSSRDTYA